jgi:ornithine carbamoyltransferase
MPRKDLVSLRGLTRDDIFELFKYASQLKSERLNTSLKGKVLALVFEKPSLRTRVTFETGIYELGGYAIYLSPSDIGLGSRESVKDAALNLSRWLSVIVTRTFSHETVLEFARYATIPVINGLSDLEHPCQALADLFTIYEKKGDLSKTKLAYLGDGNNVCHSLMLGASICGISMRVATPRGYEPKKEYVDKTWINVISDPYEAVRDVDVIYTDVWTSMGQEAEREERIKNFKKFQVNKILLNYAKKDVHVMHCLPAHRGEEITDDVIDGSHSIVFDQAENRLHIQKAILLKLLT